MANAYRITVGDSTPTLVWSGVGLVNIRTLSGAGVVYGGASVSLATGAALPGTAFPMRLSSPDEIYALSLSGNTELAVFEAR